MSTIFRASGSRNPIVSSFLVETRSRLAFAGLLPIVRMRAKLVLLLWCDARRPYTTASPQRRMSASSWTSSIRQRPSTAVCPFSTNKEISHARSHLHSRGPRNRRSR